MSTHVYSTKGGPAIYTRVGNSIMRHEGAGPAVAFVRGHQIWLNDCGGGAPSYCVSGDSYRRIVSEGENPGGPEVFHIEGDCLYEGYGGAWLRVDDNDYMLLAAAGGLLRYEHDMRMTPGGWVPDSLTSYAKTPEGNVLNNPDVDPLPDPMFDDYYRGGHRDRSKSDIANGIGIDIEYQDNGIGIGNNNGNIIYNNNDVEEYDSEPEEDDGARYLCDLDYYTPGFRDDIPAKAGKKQVTAATKGCVHVESPPFTRKVTIEDPVFAKEAAIALPILLIMIYGMVICSWWDYNNMNGFFLPTFLFLVHIGSMTLASMAVAVCLGEICKGIKRLLGIQR